MDWIHFFALYVIKHAINEVLFCFSSLEATALDNPVNILSVFSVEH